MPQISSLVFHVMVGRGERALANIGGDGGGDVRLFYGEGSLGLWGVQSRNPSPFRAR